MPNFQTQNTVGMEFEDDDDAIDTHFSESMLTQAQSCQRRWTKGQFDDDGSESPSEVYNMDEDDAKSFDSDFELVDGYG